MFYVSSVIDRDRKIGVTDTKDGIEEFYTDAQIADFLKKDKIDIYGTSYYNYKANCTALKINQTLSESKLKTLIADWGRIHNQWTGHPVEDYLASAKIGTKIIVEYVYTGDGDRRKHRGITRLIKLNYDEWYYGDTDNIASDSNVDNRGAAHCLEVACLCSKLSIILVTQVD